MKFLFSDTDITFIEIIVLEQTIQLYNLTRLILSGFDPADLRRSPDLLAAFGTVAEKRLSISDTSNSGALEYKREH